MRIFSISRLFLILVLMASSNYFLIYETYATDWCCPVGVCRPGSKCNCNPKLVFGQVTQKSQDSFNLRFRGLDREFKVFASKDILNKVKEGSTGGFNLQLEANLAPQPGGQGIFPKVWCMIFMEFQKNRIPKEVLRETLDFLKVMRVERDEMYEGSLNGEYDRDDVSMAAPGASPEGK